MNIFINSASKSISFLCLEASVIFAMLWRNRTSIHDDITIHKYGESISPIIQTSAHSQIYGINHRHDKILFDICIEVHDSMPWINIFGWVYTKPSQQAFQVTSQAKMSWHEYLSIQYWYLFIAWQNVTFSVVKLPYLFNHSHYTCYV